MDVGSFYLDAPSAVHDLAGRNELAPVFADDLLAMGRKIEEPDELAVSASHRGAPARKTKADLVHATPFVTNGSGPKGLDGGSHLLTGTAAF